MDAHPRLPAAIELAWGLRTPVRSGPKPKFTLPRIVAAAITLVDRTGLETFSMNKLADELGTKTMSLYRYVESKEDLLTLMLDLGYGPLPGDTPPASPPRAGLEFWARRMFATYQAHPWMLKVRIRSLPTTPNALAWVDYGLQCLAGTRLSDTDRLNGLLLLDGHVRNSSRLATDLGETGGSASQYSRIMGGLVRAEDYPALARMIASGAVDSRDRDQADQAGFEFGLTRVLDWLTSA
ncbi:TetR/AcrR family transcriptional regulator [Kibdelosporangium phytohabitans]|uniref:HTH tetR-type domain-containing protein n=1 Tax=Kibdelosporangium phytohabitans TaxID=860235 RepID=A0A0N9IC59_9PSEU|nr:TetR/AcrR family transcriptional regulator [Kibdelosporangium phytohabitans]ALG12128.1 hypothetical protein AOZ06_39405 [Kibdelosporangium phytohabitans]MBE1463635.1 AcrR family transcriptional regulator [Kibdelosporangium phytohabitans]